jgi:hypothetical protein
MPPNVAAPARPGVNFFHLAAPSGWRGIVRFTVAIRVDLRASALHWIQRHRSTRPDLVYRRVHAYHPNGFAGAALREGDLEILQPRLEAAPEGPEVLDVACLRLLFQ